MIDVLSRNKHHRQSGFGENRYKIDHLVALNTKAKKVTNNEQHSLAVFFELEKVYDRASRSNIFHNAISYDIQEHVFIYYELSR